MITPNSPLHDPLRVVEELSTGLYVITELKRRRRWWRFWEDPFPLMVATARLATLVSFAETVVLPPLPSEHLRRFELEYLLGQAKELTCQG
jgi:hypothetical protein